jgi:post-segregation antitoxin (ccd killing protein)
VFRKLRGRFRTFDIDANRILNISTADKTTYKAEDEAAAYQYWTENRSSISATNGVKIKKV